MKTRFIKLDFLLQNRLFFTLMVLLLLISLYTIRFLPTPWFDEVFFADLSHSMLHLKRYFLKCSPLGTTYEYSFYGPVYFQIQAWIAALNGFSIMGFRSVNFVSGICFSTVMMQFFGKLGLNGLKQRLFLLLFLVDPVVQFNLHSGRMDFLAMFFTAAGLLSFLHFIETRKWFWLASGGFLLALGYLTTPRVVFLIAPVFLYIFVRFRQNHLKEIVLLSVIFIIPVLVWIFFYFGSIQNYVTAFSKGHGVSSHIGADTSILSFWRYHYYVFWYLLIMISSAVQLKFLVSRKSDAETLFFLATIILFHLLVVERGPYSAMIMPFYAGLILHTWEKVKASASLNSLFFVGILSNLLIFSGIFLTKSGLAILNHSRTDEKQLRQLLPLKMLQGKKMVSSFEYFYVLHSIGCPFYGFQLGPIPERIRYHFQDIDFDYLLLTKQEAACHQMIEYSRGGKLTKIQEFKMPESPASKLAAEIAVKFNVVLPDYSGVLFKRERP